MLIPTLFVVAASMTFVGLVFVSAHLMEGGDDTKMALGYYAVNIIVWLLALNLP